MALTKAEFDAKGPDGDGFMCLTCGSGYDEKLPACDQCGEPVCDECKRSGRHDEEHKEV